MLIFTAPYGAADSSPAGIAYTRVHTPPSQHTHYLGPGLSLTSAQASVCFLSLSHTHTHAQRIIVHCAVRAREMPDVFLHLLLMPCPPRSIRTPSRKYAAVLCVWVYVCFLCVILSLIIKGSLISSHPMLGLICILCQELMASPDGSLGKSLKTADWLACVYSLQRFSSWLICCCLFCFPAVLVSAHFKPRIHLNILYDFALPEL